MKSTKLISLFGATALLLLTSFATEVSANSTTDTTSQIKTSKTAQQRDAQEYTVKLVNQLNQPLNGEAGSSVTLTPGETINSIKQLYPAYTVIEPNNNGFIRLTKPVKVPDNNSQTITVQCQTYIDGSKLVFIDDSGKLPYYTLPAINENNDTAAPIYGVNYSMLLTQIQANAAYPKYLNTIQDNSNVNSATQQKILNHYFTGIDELFANSVSDQQRQSIIKSLSGKLNAFLAFEEIKVRPVNNFFLTRIDSNYQQQKDQGTVTTELNAAQPGAATQYANALKNTQAYITNDFNSKLPFNLDAVNKEIADQGLKFKLGLKQLHPGTNISVHPTIDLAAQLDLTKNSATNLNQIPALQISNFGYYTLPIHYYEDGKLVAIDNAPKSVNAVMTESSQLQLPQVAGYTLDKVQATADETGLPADMVKLTADQIKVKNTGNDTYNYQVTAGIDGTINVYYVKQASNPSNPGTNPSNPSTPSNPTQPETPTNPEQPTIPVTPEVPSNQRFKVYAKTALNEYSSPLFTSRTKRNHYVKKARVYAPSFTVKKVVTNANGRSRYLLTNGRYITANSNNVGLLYWQGNYHQLYVVNPRGTYEYKSVRFNHANRVRIRKQGEKLAVKKVVHHGLTTRYQLTNGNYVSGNKQWTAVNKWRVPKVVQAKTALNRYADSNLRHRNKHYQAKTKFKVIGFDYSNGFQNKGYTLRYKVAGGYISGNSRLVRIINR